MIDSTREELFKMLVDEIFNRLSLGEKYRLGRHYAYCKDLLDCPLNVRYEVGKRCKKFMDDIRKG